MCQTPLFGKFATFRVKPVLGETFMPLGCVILEEPGKPSANGSNTIRKASPKSVILEHALYAVSKIVIFIQGGDTLSKKVMEHLSSVERRSVVDESSSIALSLLKRDRCAIVCACAPKRARMLQTCNAQMVVPSIERRCRSSPQVVWERGPCWLSDKETPRQTRNV